MKTARLVIPKLAPSLNGSKGLIRMHHHTYRKLRNDWVWLIKEAMQHEDFTRFLPEPPLDRPCSVLVRRYYARLPLDPDNLYSAVKVPMDAMRHAGVIADDNPEIVRDLRCRQIKVTGVRDQRTEIELSW